MRSFKVLLQNVLSAQLAFALSPPLIRAPGSVDALALADANPFVGREFYANKAYAAKLDATIAYFQRAGDALNAARTRTVQNIGTFVWISSSADITVIRPLIAEVRAKERETGKKQIVQLVIYNLPERDCSAKASDGEFHLDQDGWNKYKGYIDRIAAELSTPDAKELTYAIILEPDSLANVVTSLDIPKCAKAEQVYRDGIGYAIRKLQQDNIHLYIDAAHGGWLGWSENLDPTAVVFRDVIDRAGPNARVRGVSINVSNYNPYNTTTRPPYTQGNDAWNEQRYAQKLSAALTRRSVPAHLIVDQGRAGNQGVRDDWEWWCNLREAGFGQRPRAVVQGGGSDTNVDAVVWVKPGGESDGTSDRNAVRFDENCQGPFAHTPAPEAGDWFNEFAANLVKNANPPLEPTY